MPSISSIFVAVLFVSTFLQVSVLGSEDTNGSADDESDANIGGRRPCGTLLERSEWRTLTDNQKSDYIKAIKCLQSKPALQPVIKEAKTRFDEFQAYHIAIADTVHLVGQFLPWHRLFVKSYETALREECGYKGANPYWDWSQDAAEFAQSPVFDPVTGFGGDGVPGTYTLPPYGNDSKIYDPHMFVGCVQNGPFAQYPLSIGPGKLVTDHCLTRGINNTYSSKYLSAAAVALATRLPTFELFHVQLEGEPLTPDHGIHDGGHIAIGGEMSNFYSSPGDPVFYLHHSNLDRVWWNWQQALPQRLYEISGRSTTTPPFKNVTLDYTLLMGNLGETRPIRDVMDIHSEPLCYTYV
ncbi:Tyrosinase P [Psilocybe cubensis]|uniref:Tyrosinase P n=2 Tax=Psilocybe cubensis TaxID=181762 RepID=A0ACB8GU20_PSICU|nr:Tyrosinase P [Psilocybe cubensis]KAH9478721.1 Tyrosinase P [Psilocybe cubensis]